MNNRDETILRTMPEAITTGGFKHPEKICGQEENVLFRPSQTARLL